MYNNDDITDKVYPSESYRSAKRSRASASYKRPVKRSYTSGYYRGNNYGTSYLETFIFQCVVCAVILCIALLIRVIKTPFTQALRMNISSALTENIDPNDTVNNSQGIAGIIDGIGENVKNLIFEPDTETVVLSPLPDENAEVIQMESTPVTSDTQDRDFRIDEDILETMREENNAESQDNTEGIPLP
jgi:preprotein translocase subunit YajC